jgi:hypothetical protein
MTDAEPNGPYIYQPFGSVSNPEHDAVGRLWGIGGLHPLTTIKGLTRDEAAKVLDALMHERINDGQGWTEANVVVNGQKLSFGQAMALRVAASSFLTEMNQPGALGSDDAGRAIAKGYGERLSEVVRLMLGDAKV